MSRWRLGFVLGLLFFGAVSASGEERWYRVEVDGQAAGWFSEIRRSEGDSRITETEMELRFRRGSAEQSLRLASKFVEDETGVPRSAWLRQELGAVPVETQFTFESGVIRMVQSQGENEHSQRLPYPDGPWLTPGARLAAVQEHLAAGRDEFRLRSMDPQMGVQPIEEHWQLEERDVVLLVHGGEVITSRWRQVQASSVDFEVVTHLDDRGRMVRTSTPLMGMEMVAVLSSREEAMARQQAPEVMVRTLVFPDRPIPSPRKVRRAVYEIRAGNASVDDLPNTGSQTVEVTEDGVRLVVDLDRGLLGEVPPSKSSSKPSAYIDHEDPVVRQLCERALAKVGEEPADRAEALRRFVGRHLHDKNLGSVLASASEVARSGSGDCTEHSVLLAALLRADGIPARLAAGLVYVKRLEEVENLFGYHMWTQAWIGERWVDFDATLPVPFDATHITLVTTDLADGQDALLELAQIAPLIGQLEIRVLDLEMVP